MTATATATKSTKVSKTAKTPAARATAGQEPSLRFYHSKALRKRTDTVLAALEATPEKPQHADAVAGLVAELVEAGMDYYFLVPLKKAEVGFLKEQSARLGMTGAVTLINSVSRKFIVRMDATQLLVVAAHIRSLT
jgi:N-acetyl-beta-hexosaminidase